MVNKDIYNRLKGMIYGLVVGDCLGACIEFSDKDNHLFVTDYQNGGPHNLRAGDWTDDTAMALAIMDSIICCYGEVNKNDVMDKFCQWFRNGKYSSNGYCFDIGFSTSHALNNHLINKKYHLHREKMNQSESKGNGSIMRLAPTVVYDFIKNDNNYSKSFEISNLTHENEYVLDVVKKMCNVLFSHLKGVKTEIQSAYKERKEVSNSGLAMNTFNAAMWAFHSTSNFEEGMISAVNLGGDSDTIGAVYGQIAGAYYGYDAIPERWRNGIIEKVFIDNLFNDMMKVLEKKENKKWKEVKEKNFLQKFVKKVKTLMKHLKE